MAQKVKVQCWGPVWFEKLGWCWVTSRSGWLLELLTELIKWIILSETVAIKSIRIERACLFSSINVIEQANSKTGHSQIESVFVWAIGSSAGAKKATRPPDLKSMSADISSQPKHVGPDPKNWWPDQVWKGYFYCRYGLATRTGGGTWSNSSKFPPKRDVSVVAEGVSASSTNFLPILIFQRLLSFWTQL